MKKILFWLLLVTPFTIMAQDETTGQQPQNSRTEADFSTLRAGLNQQAVVDLFGEPDEYRANNSTQYVYYINNDNYVVVRFNTSTFVVTQASVWPKRILSWPRIAPPIRPVGRTLALYQEQPVQIENQSPITEADTSAGL